MNDDDDDGNSSLSQNFVQRYTGVLSEIRGATALSPTLRRKIIVLFIALFSRFGY